MTTAIAARRYVDGAGAIKEWVNHYPGLCGKSGILNNGLVLNPPRSSSQGAIATVQEIAPSRADDISHDLRLSFAVSAVGTSGGRGRALLACRALAEALATLDGRPVDVTTALGEQVRILVAYDPDGPTLAGDVGGEMTYRLDVSLRCIPLPLPVPTRLYGQGDYGLGNYGS